MTRWLTDDQQRTWRSFLAAFRHIETSLDRQMQRDAAMPLAYYLILAMLSEAPDRTLRMSELAAKVDASPSRLSHSMDRLERQGLVERQRCSGDRRGIEARLTPAGYDVVLTSAPGHAEQVMKTMFDRLTPVQVAQLADISTAILGDQN